METFEPQYRDSQRASMGVVVAKAELEVSEVAPGSSGHLGKDRSGNFRGARVCGKLLAPTQP